MRITLIALDGRQFAAHGELDRSLAHSIAPEGRALDEAVNFAQELADSTHPSSMALRKRIVESWIRYPSDAAGDASMYMSASAYGSGLRAVSSGADARTQAQEGCMSGR